MNEVVKPKEDTDPVPEAAAAEAAPKTGQTQYKATRIVSCHEHEYICIT